MKKIIEFLKDKINYISFVLILFIFLKTCTTNGKVTTVGKKVDGVSSETDTLKNEIVNLTKELRKEIKLEGLKTEKRMIQSTDRKILDVNRQSEIDKEISNLNN